MRTPRAIAAVIPLKPNPLRSAFLPFQSDQKNPSRRIITTSTGSIFTGESTRHIKPASRTSGQASRAQTPHRAILSVDERSDESLLADYVEGDREAFQSLMGRYAHELLHFLIRFLGSRAAADDVFQEAFLQVHLSASTFDPTRRFKPWLFTIAANKARDYHRKHSKRQPVSLSASVGQNAEGDQFVDLLQADIPTPDQPLVDSERSRLVKSVVDSMPVHLREILLLSYFQRLSYNQIADSLEIPLGTVKSRLHAAVAMFAKSWKAARQNSAKHSSGDQRSEIWNEEEDSPL
ncbi:MAG TPA: sigma-70 family RNA polymerase sigma factor [Phycisphaerales bacterium]|nr:sigma-70 family RNA polymerase sigma factor [Phycisphaerales bacterium]